MKPKIKKQIKQLEGIAERIDTLGISDADGWRKVAADLKKIAGRPSQQPDGCKKLISLSLEGIAAIADQTTDQTIALIGAVNDALGALIAVLSQEPEADAAIGGLSQALDQLLAPSTADADPVDTGPPNGHPVIQTLDDAAAFLIQLEPDDAAGWQHLQASIERMAEAEHLCNQNARKVLQKVIGHLEGYERVADADAGDWTQTAGQLIEEAIQAAETDGRQKPSPIEMPELPEPARAAAAASEANSDGDPDKDHMPQDADPDLLAEFIAESNDLIAAAEEALLLLETDPEDTNAVAKVFRAFHTVKGTSAFMDLGLIADLGHHAETLLSRVREREIRYAGGYADLSLRALDMIKMLVDSAAAALGGTPLLKPAGYDELLAVLSDPEAAGVSENRDDVAAPRIGDLLVAQGKVARDRVEAAVAQHPGQPVGTAVVKSKTAAVTDVGQALRAQSALRAVPGALMRPCGSAPKDWTS